MHNSIENEIKLQPLIYDDCTVGRSSEEKWLRDMLSDGGLIKSVEATVKSRTLSAIFEKKTVSANLRIQIIGGIKWGPDIAELALIPSLLHNAGTLTQISNQAMDSVRSSCFEPVLY